MEADHGVTALAPFTDYEQILGVSDILHGPGGSAVIFADEPQARPRFDRVHGQPDLRPFFRSCE